MTTPNVQVRFSADDQATDVARKLLEVLRQLDKQQKDAAASAGTLAAPVKTAADGFDRMSKSIIGLRSSTGGLDAISKRVALLGQGLQSASTRSASLTKLQAAELQLQKALQQSNLTLEQRIQLERELATIRSTIQGATPDVPQGALSRFQQLHATLVSIAAAIGAIRLLGIAKDAIDAADSMEELSQRTGVSVESLSVLAAEAKKAGADTESLATGFRQLAKTLEDMRSGNQQAAASFRAIGLSANDLKGLSLDQVLIRVANAMAKFEDGSGKSAVATQIFGRAGEQLIPLLEQLANGGFDRAREKAEALGAVLSGDAAHAAGEFNDALVNLRSSLSGFTNQLAGPLQGLSNLINGVAEFLGKLPGPLKAFMVGAGVAGAAALVLAGAVGALVFALGALAEVSGVGVIAAIIGAITGLGAAAASSSALVKELGSDLSALDKDDKLAALVATNPTGQKKGTIAIPDPAAEKAARAAQLAQIRQAAQDELAATRAGLAETEEIENERFAQRLTSLSGFFRARTNIVEQGIAAELKAQNQQLTRLKAEPLTENTEAARTQRTTEIQALEASIARTKVEGETRLLSLVEQERVARKSAETEFTSFIAQIATAQGQTLQATEIQIAQAAERFREVLSNLGVDSTQSEALVGTFTTLLTNRAVIADQQAKAERELNVLARERATIEQQVSEGTISERDGVLAIAESERQHKVSLQETVTLMRQFAEETKDPALLDAADQLQQHINSIGKVTLESTRLIANLRDSLLSAAESDLSGFLGSAINEVTSLGDAFRQLGATVIGSFQRIAAQILSAQIIEKIDGLLGRSTSGGQIATAAAALGASATATSAAGAVVNTSAVSLGGSAGALTASGGILLSAAAALTAAAAALAAAGAVAGLQAGLASLPAALGFASGGHVTGPGSGTSDSIPARLSAGEFVQPARTVEHYGVRFMESLRRREIPRDVLFGREQRRDSRGEGIERSHFRSHTREVSVVRFSDSVFLRDSLRRVADYAHVLAREFVRVVLGERGIREGDQRGDVPRSNIGIPVVGHLDRHAADGRPANRAAPLAALGDDVSRPVRAGDDAERVRPLVLGERGRDSVASDVRHESRSLVSRVVETIRETLLGRVQRSEFHSERSQFIPPLAPLARDFLIGKTNNLHVLVGNLVERIRERAETESSTERRNRRTEVIAEVGRVIQSGDITEQRSVSRDDRRSSSLVAHVVRSVVETVHRLTSLRREERSELRGEHANIVRHPASELLPRRLEQTHIVARDLSRIIVRERSVRESHSDGGVVPTVGPVRGAVARVPDVGVEQPGVVVNRVGPPRELAQGGPPLGREGGLDRGRVSHATLALGILHDSATRVLETVRDRVSSLVGRQERSEVRRDSLQVITHDPPGGDARRDLVSNTRIVELTNRISDRAHVTARELVQQLRERSESVHLARQEHHLTDRSSTRNDTAQERRVSREDREFLLSASHEHRSLVSRTLQTIRETLFGREERVQKLTELNELRRVTMMDDARRDLAAERKVPIVPDVDVKARPRHPSIVERHERLPGIAAHLRIPARVPLHDVVANQHANLAALVAVVGKRLTFTNDSVIRGDRSSSVSHETRSLSVVQYTIRRVFETLARDVLEFARVIALATNVAHSSTSSVQAFASGGYVRGPGTATSDSIPARLSDREFVQPARATAYYGVSVMEAIRTLRIPRELLLEFTAGLHTPRVTSIDSIGVPQFAEGGLVTIEQQQQAAAAAPARNDTLHVLVEHSEDAIVRVISGTKGLRALTRLMQANKSQIKAVLT